ncbi:hypothetical protein MRB53_014170 [Persea americana]|uniref:Uncharacterized protein n=1 Tax=Persea americana TaxID=3435 RepID=A0ACC2KAK3_PERAE|nr:hypothetical protein MRB53_014170 [Persea americana]
MISDLRCVASQKLGSKEDSQIISIEVCIAVCTLSQPTQRGRKEWVPIRQEISPIHSQSPIASEVASSQSKPLEDYYRRQKKSPNCSHGVWSLELECGVGSSVAFWSFVAMYKLNVH